jgi:hypothetical protein
MRRTPTITRVVSVAVTTLVVTSTCWAGGLDLPDGGSASVHPLWLPNERHPLDERLLGDWSTYFVFDMGIWLYPAPIRLHVVARRDTSMYELTFSPGRPDDESEIPPLALRGFLVPLKGHLFLDLTAADKSPSFHRVFLVIFDKGIPRLVRWSFWSLREGAAKKIGLRDDGGYFVASASTKQLRKFVVEHADDWKVFQTSGQECGESCIGKLPDDVFPLLPEGTELVPGIPNRNPA